MCPKLLPLMIALSGIAFAMPGCAPQRHVLLDRSVPHQLSRDADVYVYERQPDGTFVEEYIHTEKGWLIAAPEVVAPSH